MCGRFVASRPVSQIVDVFDVEDVEVPEELAQPRWNIAPQSGVLAVTLRRPKAAPEPEAAARRRLTSYRWGLVPSWAKDPGFGARAFNARAESLLDKPAFRASVERHRCLIPADAFYEWEKPSRPGRDQQAGPRQRRRRQPWCYRAPGGGLLAFAGLWAAWKVRQQGGTPLDSRPPADDVEAQGEEEERAAGGWHDDWLLSCTVITVPANETVAPVHDRMPLVLDPLDWDDWLRPGPLGEEELGYLLRTPSVDLLEAYEVSPEVNSSTAEGPQLVEPSGAEASSADAEPTLF